MFPAMKAMMLVLAVGLPALCRAAPPRNMKAIELVGHVTDFFYTHNWRNLGPGILDNPDLITLSQGGSIKMNYTYRF